jgi:hypothetical protein
MERIQLLWSEQGGAVMTDQTPRALRCAIYTRKSTEEGLEQEFNSLDAQREAAAPNGLAGGRSRSRRMPACEPSLRETS